MNAHTMNRPFSRRRPAGGPTGKQYDRTAGTTVRSGYSYLTTDPDLEKSIGFREVDPDRDLGRLHAWLNSDHVLPYWEQDDPLLQVRETINERAQNEDQTLYIGYLDHTPMSYWESYWAA